MKQLTAINQLGETFYLYKQSTTTDQGFVTLHFFSKNPDFNKSVQPASEFPDGYVIHEDPFNHRITLPPTWEAETKLLSVYKERV